MIQTVYNQLLILLNSVITDTYRINILKFCYLELLLESVCYRMNRKEASRMSSLGKRITQLREGRKMTQDQLAKKLNISRASLSHYEQSRREPDYETVVRIANYFRVSLDYLFGRTALPTQNLDADIRQFVDSLELSDREILDTFALTVDGRELTAEEARRFIAFIRAERSMKL